MVPASASGGEAVGRRGGATLRAVFFDAGGTLLHVDYQRVGRVIRQVLGRWPTPAELAAAEYAGRDAVEVAMASNGASTDAVRWSIHFLEMLRSLGYRDEEIEAAAPAVLAEHLSRNLWAVTQPGTAEGLAALRGAGLVVACVSNADGTVNRLLEQAGLLGRLDFVVDSAVVGVEKPDPRIFEVALERAGVRAAESLYVGDLYPVDVVGARRAGLEPVLLDPLGRYGARDCRTARDVPSFCHELVSALRVA